MIESNVLEKRWITASGLEAAVVFNSLGHRCGYVNVPEDHGLFDVGYEEIDHYVDVHGGLTFSGNLPTTLIPEDLYWFGYDCAHSCDRTRYNPRGIARTLEFCVENCESLASQLHETPLSLFYLAKKHGKISLEHHRKMLCFGVEEPSNHFVKQYFELLSKERLVNEQQEVE